VLVGEDGESVLRETVRLLAGHRVWDRFATGADLI
jgi:hypothetical protein